MLLIFWIWLSQFVCLVARICGVWAYFQPHSVASARIQLSRISAENMVQPAEFFEKSGWGVYKHPVTAYIAWLWTHHEAACDRPRCCYYQVRCLCQICRYATPDVAIQLVLALVISRLEYCNSMFVGLRKSTLVTSRRAQSLRMMQSSSCGLFSHQWSSMSAAVACSWPPYAVQVLCHDAHNAFQSVSAVSYWCTQTCLHLLPSTWSVLNDIQSVHLTTFTYTAWTACLVFRWPSSLERLAQRICET